jgi:hypothetical protein
MDDRHPAAWTRGWLVRFNSTVPLWWAGTGHAWTELPQAMWWPHVPDAVLALIAEIGPTWQTVARLQQADTAADEWALWFAECWTEACEQSGLEPRAACGCPTRELVGALQAGILSAGRGERLGPRWAEVAQRWAGWAFERSDALLADLEGPPSTA